MRLFQPFELLIQLVVFRVADLRPIEDIVEVIVTLDQASKLFNPCVDLGRARHIPPDQLPF
jgi:hypothetical protein